MNTIFKIIFLHCTFLATFKLFPAENLMSTDRIQEQLLLENLQKELQERQKTSDQALFEETQKFQPSLEKIKRLIKLGADVNAKDVYGYTPLHLAQTAEQTKALIAAGADINAKNFYGESPLHSAKTAEQTKALIAAGADVNAKDRYGQTTLDLKNPNNAEFLLKHGANPRYSSTISNMRSRMNVSLNTQDEDSRTLLHRVVNNDEMRRELLANHANPNVQDELGRTPLFYALTPQAVHDLIVARANVNARDNEGNTPLHEVYGFPERAETLIAAGADLDAKNNAGETPLEHERNKKHIDVINILKQAKEEKEFQELLHH